MFKVLKLTSIFISCFLTITLNPVFANFTPKESPPPESNAQGTRGCPISIGDLALFGPRKVGKHFFLDINIIHSNILFKIKSQQQETIKLNLTEVAGKIDQKSLKRIKILEKEINPRSNEYVVLNLPSLDRNKNYLLTIVLLCGSRTQYGKTFQAWLSFVNYPTPVNLFIQSLKLSNFENNAPKNSKKYNY